MTVKTRITCFIVGAGVISSFLFSVIIFFELLEQPLYILDTVLLEEARQTTQMFAQHRTEPEKIHLDSFSHKNKRYWIEIYDSETNERLFQSDLAKMVKLPQVASGSSAIKKAITPYGPDMKDQSDDNQKVTFRIKTYSIGVDGQFYITQIAKSMERLNQEKKGMILGIISGLVFSTLILIAISRFIAGRILRPIGEMRDLAQNINEKHLDQRIPSGEGVDEFSELTRTINRMLDRLQYSFLHQRDFLFATSHELKTPLTTIRLTVDEICSSSAHALPPPMTQDNLLRLNTHVLRMERLVKDLLHLSSLETMLSINPAPVQLFDLLSSLAHEYKFMADAQNITMTINLPQELVIQGDEAKLRRAFSNILDNALKYNTEGGQIELTGDLTSSQLIFTFSNTGPGVDESDIPMVFNQFYRVDKSRSSELGGSGLGLSIAKRIIELHEGWITFESVKGSWTHVTVTLPTGR